LGKGNWVGCERIGGGGDSMLFSLSLNLPESDDDDDDDDDDGVFTWADELVFWRGFGCWGRSE